MRVDSTQALGPQPTNVQFLMLFIFCFLVSFEGDFFAPFALPLRISWLLVHVSYGQNFSTKRMGLFTIIQIYILSDMG